MSQTKEWGCLVECAGFRLLVQNGNSLLTAVPPLGFNDQLRCIRAFEKRTDLRENYRTN